MKNTHRWLLSYCSNIHPGESWDAHFAELRTCFPEIKRGFMPDQEMGLGLRLSNEASIELAKTPVLQEFKAWLEQQNAFVFTMNGFPYGGFHHTVVKDQVHAPDWQTSERLDYTLRCFRILKELLPPGIHGGISTSPLSYALWLKTSAERQAAVISSSRNMLKVVEALAKTHASGGPIMHLDVEPEPDGLLSTGNDFINWYVSILIPMARNELSKSMKITEAEAEEILKLHLRLCYDVCHIAIAFEDHTSILERMEKEGIKVGKLQISAALKVRAENKSRQAIAQALSEFNEPTYLHQVLAMNQDGTLKSFPDLSLALEDIQNPEISEWRAHFHVPIFLEDLGLLQSTQSDIISVMNLLRKRHFCDHLEVETYTWDVLPEEFKMDIAGSVIRELKWLNQLSR